MSVFAGRSQLYDALKVLRVRWQDAQDHWRDEIAQEFEEQYQAVVDSSTMTALEVMDRLEVVLKAIRRDCGEQSEIL